MSYLQRLSIFYSICLSKYTQTREGNNSPDEYNWIHPHNMNKNIPKFIQNGQFTL